MKKLLLISFVINSLLSQAQLPPYFNWAFSIGGNGNDYPNSIANDIFGNVILTGEFSLTADLDPGPLVSSNLSNGNDDIFIQKLDPLGNLIWVKTIGGITADDGQDITTDNMGNIYVCGRFSGTVDFDPGVGVVNKTTPGNNHTFVLKLDANGDFIWVQSFGGGVNTTIGKHIKLDDIGNVYISGYFDGTTDFDPGLSVANKTAVGGNDAFLVKLNGLGNYLWSETIGNTNTDSGRETMIDPNGNIYFSGVFSEVVDFNPGAGINNLGSAGTTHGFIQKLDSFGNFIWARMVGTDVMSIKLDLSGNLIAAGTYGGVVDFDPGVGVLNSSSFGSADLFISKYNNSGDLVWAKFMGGVSADYMRKVVIDNNDNIYSTGYFQGTADYDPSVGVATITSLGNLDVFIHGLDTNGDFLWVKTVGGTGTDVSTSISSFDQALYIAGWFNGSGDYNPELGVLNLTSNGGEDGFEMKLSICQSSYNIINPSVCQSYTVPSGDETYTISGTYYDTIPNLTGCDSLITINLTVYSTDATNYIQTACDSYTWIDGNTYTSSNNAATWTLTNASGCDSVVTLNLTINTSTTGTDVQTACDSYTWIDGNTYTSSNNVATWTLTNDSGCDSVVTLDLTINTSTTGTDIQTACDSYTWIDGNTYTSSNNVATWTLTNDSGCDSVVTLDLTINTVNVGVTNTSPILTANSSGTTYQWLNCNENFAEIPGENNQSFTATVNGNYAVVVSDDNCSDTSTCIAVTNMGILENDFGTALIIFPNPTKGELSVDLGVKYNEVNIIVRNTLGQEILKKTYSNSKVLQLNIPSESGLHIIEVSTINKKAQLKVIKE